MRLVFKKQKFQTDAVNAVCDVFKGQPKRDLNSYLMDSGLFAKQNNEFEFGKNGYRNAPVELNDEDVLENLQRIQRNNGLKPSEQLEGHYNLTVEMETGVGKTYTYIKTMHELNKRYGWSKFIIIVPSIAIREGVKKSLDDTQSHFLLEYGNTISSFIYSSKDIQSIQSFADSSGINVMVINSQAFNARGEDARRINMELDELQSRSAISIIAQTNPIIIIDEPQSVEGESTIKNMQKFNAMITLRYSATHRKDRIFNMVYRLDAVDAFRKKLVKKISVCGYSFSVETGTNSYLCCKSVETAGINGPVAKLEFDINGVNSIRKTERIVNRGFDLYQQSGNLEEYKGFIVEEIDSESKTITFSNGVKVEENKPYGNAQDIEQLRRIQIRYTIKKHLEREANLFRYGIKVLSLFFIDEVAKYRQYNDSGACNGEYAIMFEEEYKKAVDDYLATLDLYADKKYVEYLKSITASETHKGYFSIDKKTNRFVDGKIDKKEQTSSDVDAYDLIMKNKERLLSFEEHTRFIFSHSALKEGWDNPNIFQICTLKQSNAEIKKRQEIGRGLRLCVDQNGNRMDEEAIGSRVHEVNLLTVIASDSYEEFTKGLQDEFAKVVSDRPRKVDINLFINKTYTDINSKEEFKITEELATEIYENLIRNDYVKGGNLTDKYYEHKKAGIIAIDDNLADKKDCILSILDTVYDPREIMPEDENERKIEININNENFNKKEFRELWSKINRKTFYTVDFDPEELVKRSIQKLDDTLNINRQYITAKIGVMKNNISKENLEKNTVFSHEGDKQIIENIENPNSNEKYDLVGKIAQKTLLTRKIVIDILKGIKPETFEKFKYRSEEFITKTSKIINEQKSSIIINKITYTPIDGDDGVYSSDIFTCEKIKGTPKDTIETPYKNVYDHLLADSSVEKKFASSLDTAEEVAVYTKLPKSFFIPTPVGDYNPDWAITFKNNNVKYIYFIAETKGNLSSLQLREIENGKIKCARKHFAAISSSEVEYDVINSYDELMQKVMK